MIVFNTGHNWGSQHDPADTECAPSSANGGKYLMYQYSVTGTEVNNNVSNGTLRFVPRCTLCILLRPMQSA